MKLIAEVNIKGICKHCGKSFKWGKEFGNHLAYEHEIYISKWYKFKAKIKRWGKRYE